MEKRGGVIEREERRNEGKRRARGERRAGGEWRKKGLKGGRRTRRRGGPSEWNI